MWLQYVALLLPNYYTQRSITNGVCLRISLSLPFMHSTNTFMGFVVCLAQTKTSKVMEIQQHTLHKRCQYFMIRVRIKGWYSECYVNKKKSKNFHERVEE
jgi:hypothetical protein